MILSDNKLGSIDDILIRLSASISSKEFIKSKKVCRCFLFPNSPFPKSPILTPVRTISLIPVEVILIACLIIFCKLSLLEIPRAFGIVQ